MEVKMSAISDDPTALLHPQDQEWVSLPTLPGKARVIKADEELGIVIFGYRFEPGAKVPEHRHDCHAIAYTISGEWEYEAGKLGPGSLAYEPVGSVHTPYSEDGAELMVILRSDTDQFLINIMEDGSEQPLDMAFFKQMEGVTQQELDKLVAEQQAAETS
jgi:quercetin dioxygenase-like cupin family protein